MPLQWNYPLLDPADVPADDTRYRPHLERSSAAPLGYGLAGPLRRAADADFQALSDEELIRNAVSLILLTDAASPGGKLGGELPWEQGFGSQLYLVRHRPLFGDGEGGIHPETANLAVHYTRTALTTWEPRVALKEVEATALRPERAGDPATLHLHLTYDVRAYPSPASSLLFRDVLQVVEYPIAT